MSKREKDLEQAARRTLEQHLLPNEELLEFTRCRREGFLRSQKFLIGLTENALILVPDGGGMAQDPALRIWLSSVRSLRWTMSLQRYLLINLARDNFKLRVASLFVLTERSWSKRAVSLQKQASRLIRQMQSSRVGNVQLSADSMAASNAGVVTISQSPTVSLTEEQILQQAKDFTTLGLNGSAFEIIDAALQTAPNLQFQPEVKELRAQLESNKAAYQRVGLFLLIDAGRILLTGIPVYFMGESDEFSTFLCSVTAVFLADLWIGFNLIRGRSERRNLALYWAALLLFLAAASFLEGTSLLEPLEVLSPIMLVALAISIFLPLTGSDKYRRTSIATAVFGIGYLGPFILSWITAVL